MIRYAVITCAIAVWVLGAAITFSSHRASASTSAHPRAVAHPHAIAYRPKPASAVRLAGGGVGPYQQAYGGRTDSDDAGSCRDASDSKWVLVGTTWVDEALGPIARALHDHPRDDTSTDCMSET